jgi:carboxy-terminal domain RNA polymerase II polypeptide A small phosphatase
VSIRLLVLDIDETLVKASERQLNGAADLRFREYFVYPRPYLKEFLEYCFKNFDVGVWSSARERYVTFISENIFAEKYAPKFLWSERHCFRPSTGESSIKDLRALGRLGYLPEEILVVDDSPEKIRLQPENLVHIKPYDGQLDDRELLRMIEEIEKRRATIAGGL